jgi:hypothetical protein
VNEQEKKIKRRDVTVENLTDLAKELGEVEREIAWLFMERLGYGQEDYGKWPRKDHRNYVREAIEENVDGLAYLTAELLRLDRDDEEPVSVMLRVYTCHRFAGDRVGAMRSLRRICRQLVDEGCLPVCPQLFLPMFLDEDAERNIALRLCQDMLKDCDEVRVYGREITPGMRIEISFAEALGLPIRYVDSAAEVA